MGTRALRCWPSGVGPGVGVGVGVLVGVGVIVGEGVTVGVLVAVGVGVLVGAGVEVGVSVGKEVAVGERTPATSDTLAVVGAGALQALRINANKERSNSGRKYIMFERLIFRSER